MAMNRLNSLMVLVAMLAFATTASPTAGTQVTPDEARAVAKEAYIYGYAPVDMERVRRNMVSADKDMGDGRAPQNTFGWVRILATPALSKVILMPNHDTL